MAARDETTNKKRARVDQRITSPTTKGSAAFPLPPSPPAHPLHSRRRGTASAFHLRGTRGIACPGLALTRCVLWRAAGPLSAAYKFQFGEGQNLAGEWGVGWVEVRGGGEPHTSAVTESRGPSSGRGIDHRAMSPRRLPHSLTFPPSHESHLTPT